MIFGIDEKPMGDLLDTYPFSVVQATCGGLTRRLFGGILVALVLFLIAQFIPRMFLPVVIFLGSGFFLAVIIWWQLRRLRAGDRVEVYTEGVIIYQNQKPATYAYEDLTYRAQYPEKYTFGGNFDSFSSTESYPRDSHLGFMGCFLMLFLEILAAIGFNIADKLGRRRQIQGYDFRINKRKAFTVDNRYLNWRELGDQIIAQIESHKR